MERGRRASDGQLPDAVLLPEPLTQQDWGKYTAAIERWEPLIGRSAPSPTMKGGRGIPVLNPLLPEWMMGLPEGWVTSPDLGLSRTQHLKIIGNGVCPQQAEFALETLIGDML